MKRRLITRSVPLLDLETGGSDGRTVTAYCATFDDAYEVRDVHGHYFEEIARSAFNRRLSNGSRLPSCLYNHGLTFSHTPSERFSQALGKVEMVKPDGRGVLTRTRYSRTQLADETLEQIADGTITAYSFTGPIIRTARPRPHTSGRPLIVREELGLNEFGPSPLSINAGASILAVRSELLTIDPDDLTDEMREEILALIGSPGTPPAPSGEELELEAPVPPEPATPIPDPALQLLALANANRRRREVA